MFTKSLSFLHADSEDSDQTGLMPQAELSLCWTQSQNRFVLSDKDSNEIKVIWIDMIRMEVAIF